MVEIITEKRDKLAVSVTFSKIGAFFRIEADAFGELTHEELKTAIGNAIDKYFKDKKEGE